MSTLWLIAMALLPVLLTVVVVLASWLDLRERRIPNWVTGAGLLGGLAIRAALGPTAVWSGFLGAGLGLSLGILLFAIGAMGAGDGKLLAALGALLGLEAFLWSLPLIAVFGGLLAIVMTVRERNSVPLASVREGFPLLPGLVWACRREAGARLDGRGHRSVRCRGRSRSLRRLAGMGVVAMKTWWPNWRRDESGQALVEFALITPILLLIILGLVEFSRAWNTQQVLTDTAREALRNSVVANPDFSYDQMRELINQALERASLDPDEAEVSVDGWKNGTGTPARIRIDYRYHLGFFGPIAGWTTGESTLALSTSFVMRNE